jgi:PAS domain S-box-containing protein
MEQMVWSEFIKQKVELFNIYKEKFGDRISDEEIKQIIESFDASIMDMVKLMREGKSAHEKFFSDIILNSIDAIIGYNNENQIFLWNKGAEKIFGYKKEEVQGQDISIVFPKYLIENGENDRIINEVRTKGFVNHFETERLTKSGEIINISVSSFVIKNDVQENIGVVAILRDITIQKELEKELREKENLALIGEVVSSIAHNLSNPLNIISGNADYLLLDKKEGDEGFEELKVIIEEATRITKSIRQILNFSKPVTLMKENVDVSQMLNEIVQRVKYLSSNKNIEIKTYFDKKNSRILIDKELMQDVFMNIINNSMQSIKDEGEITLKTTKNNKHFQIEISDNGVGIDKDNLDKIFKPFFTTKSYGQGTGLGLAFAERVVKKHDGKIEVKSLKGKGTTFKLTFPL